MKYFLLSAYVFFILNSCKQVEQVDLIIKNAVIYTVDSSFSVTESLAVKDGLIVATGNIPENYKADSVIDMEGKFIYPGFIDAHCHYFGYGLSLQNADLTGTRSFEEILQILERHAATHPDGWITGRGWDQNDWEIKEYPDISELNRLFPDRPVILYRIDGHAAIVNSKASEIARLDPSIIIQGGEFIKKDGKFTGTLIDNAIEMVSKFVQEPGKQEITEALLEAQENCFAVGLTSVHDAGIDADVIYFIDTLQKNGSLKMRIYAMLSPGEKNFEEFLYKGKFKTDYLNVRSVKLYADGALGSRGALLLEPYDDNEAKTGLFISEPSYIRRISQLADSVGYQVCIHCIGDGANREVLKIFSEVLEKNNDKRWRIEHAQIVHPDDINLFGEYSVIPSVQPTHATSDMYWAEDRLGERISYAYSYKSLLEQNGWLPNGSDFPVESINPILGFYAAAVRKDKTNYPENGFQIAEALSREEALKAMTIWAAKAAFEEDEKGSLETGKFADFVVLDRDIMKVEPSEIYGANVLMTFSGGKLVYSEEK